MDTERQGCRNRSERAVKKPENSKPIKLKGDTIPHEVIGEADGGKFSCSATTGTGIIAGGGVRAVLEAAGVQNVYKVARLEQCERCRVRDPRCLRQLKTYEDYKRLRS